MLHASKFLLLKDLDLFKGFSDLHMDQIARQAQFKRYKRGTFIYENGAIKPKVYIVNKGVVMIGLVNDSDKTLIKELVFGGELIGENLFTRHTSRREFALVHREAEIFELPSPFFKALLERHPSFCRKVTQILIQKLDVLEQRMQNFIFKKAQTRITDFLHKAAESRGIRIGMDEVLINHGMSHKEIACLTDTSRQTVARVLGELKKQNIIHFSARKPHKILVRNIGALAS